MELVFFHAKEEDEALPEKFTGTDRKEFSPRRKRKAERHESIV